MSAAVIQADREAAEKIADEVIKQFAEQGLRVTYDIADAGFLCQLLAAHREAHTVEMLGVLHQYVSDLRYPPTGDSIQRRIERAEAVIAKVASITDCGPDGGCEECDVCRYLNFLEWAGAVGKPEGSTIERNDTIDAYLRVTYPDQFAAGK